ncbi:MAG: nucleotidyl transferase AbiEii/AbiGii toxin family protein, partial [Myxococcaceae bacterium]|nr:nucleotidyl transferase AbiEii/AbiGii toxin family protein [Myxococcaceae bacterium]
MTAKNVSNLATSVQARLQNHARATKRPFQELLQYYAMERFLYRLSTTPHRARFVLKGALMLHVWEAPLARVTKDLDFLGRLDNSLEKLERMVREVCSVDVEPDGMVFDLATVKTDRIKLQRSAETTHPCSSEVDHTRNNARRCVLSVRGARMKHEAPDSG